jgi:hypothetical protein
MPQGRRRCQGFQICGDVSLLIAWNHPATNLIGKHNLFARLHRFNQLKQQTEAVSGLLMLFLFGELHAGHKQFAQAIKPCFGFWRDVHIVFRVHVEWRIVRPRQ